MSINGFEKIVTNNNLEMPPYLSDFEKINDFQVYKSSFDPNIYVIYDHINMIYHSYRYVKSPKDFKENLSFLVTYMFYKPK
jgi:hypothetical protein